jgi:hypothetical protein
LTLGKHFIDPKRSEIQVFPCTMQIALFWPKLLPALFLTKSWYPCPFEILAGALVTLFYFVLSSQSVTVVKFIISGAVGSGLLQMQLVHLFRTGFETVLLFQPARRYWYKMYARAKKASSQNAKGVGRHPTQPVQCKAANRLSASSTAGKKQASHPIPISQVGTTAKTATPGASSSATRRAHEPAHMSCMSQRNQTKLKTGLKRHEIISAALSSKVDVEYPSLAKIVRIFTSSTFTGM